jgi:signal peptidase I
MQFTSNEPGSPEGAGLPNIEPTPTATARRRVNWLREILETLVPAVLIALLINMFVAQATRVDGPSMWPLLRTDQRLVVEKVSYRLHPPRRGDVVVLKLPQNPAELLIKRVVALAGETIEVRDGSVWINGQRLSEAYLTQPTAGVMAPHVVPASAVFVLGDNRGSSNDSRSFGPVPLADVVGRAIFSYWPPSVVGVLH